MAGRRSHEVRFGAAPMVRTNDVDAAREVLGQTYLPLHVEPVGIDALDLQMSAVQLTMVTSGYVHFGGGVKLDAPDVRSYHIDIPLSGKAINTFGDGHEVICSTSVSGVIAMPGMPVAMAWSPGCAQVCLMISPEDVHLRLETLLDQPLSAPVAFERGLDLTKRSSASWRHLVSVLAREAGRPDGFFSHRLAAQNLQHTLIDGLLLMQPHNYTEALSDEARTASAAVVRRAIELMRTNPQAAWTTAILARETAVSARALQKAFSRSNELPPMTYLRQLRLHRAHRELLQADPNSVTVAAVASRWGFLHFGRFSQQYRQRFGQYPSETLRTPEYRRQRCP